MRRICLLVLFCAMLFLFVACKQTEPTAAEETTYAPGVRTERLFSEENKPLYVKLHAKVALGEETPSDVDLTAAFQDETAAFACTSAIGHIGILKQEDAVYTILYDEHLIIRGKEMLNKMLTDLGAADGFPLTLPEGTAFSAGCEKIDGTWYEYDEMIKDGAGVRFYYEPKTENFRYLFLSGVRIEVVQYHHNPDASLFDLPEDYKMITLADTLPLSLF